jgi:hypothetical protein
MLAPNLPQLHQAARVELLVGAADLSGTWILLLSHDFTMPREDSNLRHTNVGSACLERKYGRGRRAR